MSEHPMPELECLSMTRQPRSSPSSPAMMRRPRNALFRSFRVRGSAKVALEADEESSSTHGCPKSFTRRLIERFGSQKPQSPPLFPKCQPAIVFSPTDDEEELSQIDFPPEDSSLKTDNPSPQSQLMVEKTLRTGPSATSVESGYSSNASQSSLLSSNTTRSTPSIVGETDYENERVKESRSSVKTSEISPSDVPTDSGTTSDPDKMETLYSEGCAVNRGKDVHPNRLFFIQSSEKELCTVPEATSDFSPNPASDKSALRLETPASPAESDASSVSLASNPFSSLSGAHSRRGSLSYAEPTKTRRPSIVGTNFYKVTPRKYLKKSRATSALDLSEIMSSDAESMSGNLRQLQISVHRSGSRRSSIDKNGTAHDCPASSINQVRSPTKPSMTPSVQNDGPAGVSIGASHPRECKPSPVLYPWSCCTSQKNFSIENEMAMWGWFQEQVRDMKHKMEHRMERKVEEKIACVRRELKTKIDHGLTSVGNHVDRLEQKITRTYSDPYSQVHVFGSTDSLLSINVNMVPHRSKSTSIPPAEWMHQLMPTCIHSSQSLQEMDVKSLAELPSEPVSRDVLRDLSKELPKWEFPARALGLKEADIESIKADYPCNSREQCYKMLLMWKQRCAQNATYQALGRALLAEARNVYPNYVKIVSFSVH